MDIITEVRDTNTRKCSEARSLKMFVSSYSEGTYFVVLYNVFYIYHIYKTILSFSFKDLPPHFNPNGTGSNCTSFAGGGPVCTGKGTVVKYTNGGDNDKTSELAWTEFIFVVETLSQTEFTITKMLCLFRYPLLNCTGLLDAFLTFKIKKICSHHGKMP